MTGIYDCLLIFKIQPIMKKKIVLFYLRSHSLYLSWSLSIHSLCLSNSVYSLIDKIVSTGNTFYFSVKMTSAGQCRHSVSFINNNTYYTENTFYFSKFNLFFLTLNGPYFWYLIQHLPAAACVGLASRRVVSCAFVISLR